MYYKANRCCEISQYLVWSKASKQVGTTVYVTVAQIPDLR